MEIVKVIKESNKVFGFMIEDEGVGAYPIKTEALHSPIIFDALIESGYEFKKYPYNFKKDGKYIIDIETVELTDLNLPEEEFQYMEDMLGDLYTEVQLKSKLPDDINIIPFKTEDKYEINTREEFIKFILSIKGESLSNDDPKRYLPINYFVNPSVYFTLDEIEEEDNLYYKNCLDSRRRMNIVQFKKLVEFLKKHGLRDDYTAKDIIDCYMQWGLDGIELNRLFASVKELTHLVSFIEMNEPLKLTRTELGYINRDGSTVRPDYIATDKAWKIKENPKRQEALRVGAIDNEYNCIEPVHFEKEVTQEVTIWECTEGSVTYDASTFYIAKKGYGSMFLSTIHVYKDIFEREAIPNYLWNLDSDKSKTEVYNSIYEQALIDDMIDKKTLKTNASSFNLLRTLSMNSRKSFKFYIETLGMDGIIDVQDMESARRKIFLEDLLDKFLDCNLPQTDRYYMDLLSSYENFKEGIDNIGDIDEGKSLDECANRNLIADKIRIANVFLGLSYEEISNQISSNNNDIIYVTGRNGLCVKIINPERSNRLLGFKSDLVKYTKRKSEECSIIAKVVLACRENEIVPLNPKAKHVAVVMRTFAKNNRKITDPKNTQQVFDWVERQIHKMLENENESRKNLIENVISSNINNAIMQIDQIGYLSVPKSLGGGKIEVPEHIKEIIAKNTNTTFETLAKVTDSIYSNIDNRFQIDIVNSILTTDLVIPNENEIIKEVPFLGIWLNTAYSENARELLYKGTVIPSMNFYGYSYSTQYIESCYHFPNEVVMGSVENHPALKEILTEGAYTANSRYNVGSPTTASYYTNFAEKYRQMLKNKKWIQPPSIYDIIYPTFANKDIEVFKKNYLDTLDELEDTSYPDISYQLRDKDKSFNQFIRILNRKIIVDNYPEYYDLLNPVSTRVQLTTSLKEFYEYTLEDLRYLNSYDKLKLDVDLSSKIRAAIILKATGNIYFEDGLIINKDQLMALDTDKYAVMQVRGLKYVFEDNRGQRWEAII